jgi:hypothetical protein
MYDHSKCSKKYIHLKIFTKTYGRVGPYLVLSGASPPKAATRCGHVLKIEDEGHLKKFDVSFIFVEVYYTLRCFLTSKYRFHTKKVQTWSARNKSIASGRSQCRASCMLALRVRFAAPHGPHERFHWPVDCLDRSKATRSLETPRFRFTSAARASCCGSTVSSPKEHGVDRSRMYGRVVRVACWRVHDVLPVSQLAK